MFVLIRLEGEGHEGWGESVAEANPYYSGETTETAWHIISNFIAPLVVVKSFDHPRDIYAPLKRIRGNNMAHAGVAMAAYDLYARAQGQPLSRLLVSRGDTI